MGECFANELVLSQAFPIPFHSKRSVLGWGWPARLRLLLRFIVSTLSLTQCCCAGRLVSIMLKYCIIILFQNSSMLVLLFPCKSCYYAQICLFHNWENTLNSKRDKHPSRWLLIPALQPHCCHHWSECHCPHAGCCLTSFSEFNQLTLPNLFAAHDDCACALLLFRHNAQMLLAGNYYHIMLTSTETQAYV